MQSLPVCKRIERLGTETLPESARTTAHLFFSPGQAVSSGLSTTLLRRGSTPLPLQEFATVTMVTDHRFRSTRRENVASFSRRSGGK